MKKKQNDSKTSKYIFIVLCVVCCGLIFLTMAFDMSTGPLKYVAGYIITPIQRGVNEVGNWIADRGDYFQDSVNLAAENEELQAKVDNLTAENSQLVQDQEELERLRSLLDLKEQYSSYDMIGARITAKDTGNWFNVFTIDKGSDDGVQVDCNVISDGGLVGIVTEVGTHWATVRSIIDDSSNVSAMTVSTQDNCVVEGDLELIDEGKLSFSQLYDQDNKVTVGERIVTSNISEKYVEGLFIGYVSDIQQDSNNLTKTGTIVTPVDFQHLKDVLVITVNKQDSITEGGQNEE